MLTLVPGPSKKFHDFVFSSMNMLRTVPEVQALIWMYQLFTLCRKLTIARSSDWSYKAFIQAMDSTKLQSIYRTFEYADNLIKQKVIFMKMLKDMLLTANWNTSTPEMCKFDSEARKW